MSATTIQGVMCVGLIAQLYIRGDSRARTDKGRGWEEVRDRIGVLAFQVADRPVIDALDGTNLRSMFRAMLERWPGKAERDVEPSASLLRLLTLAELEFGEVRDAAMAPQPYVVRNVQGLGHIKMEPGEIQWGPDRTLCCPPAANPERQIEPDHDTTYWCQRFHEALQERDEARSHRMAAEADHEELMRLYEERGEHAQQLRSALGRLRRQLLERQGFQADGPAISLIDAALGPLPVDVPSIRAQAEADVAALQERLEAKGATHAR